MASVEPIPLRQRLCRADICGAVFYVCRPCDRGQRYCSERCRDEARRQQRRAANRRHQCSAEGRLDHRDRQREYRRRLVLLRVTDQGSDEGIDFSTLRLLALPPFEPDVGEVVCRFCGRKGRLIDPFTG
jgi:hypothetical protein